MRELRGLESGYQFYQAWNSDDFPRVVLVQTLHPTPYFDSSYLTDSPNNGPYERAYMEELLPRIEEEFRTIREPWARVLTGGSTGGWVSLALQLRHPTSFGGVWSFAPDSADLRRYGLVNIYDDDNAFTAPNREWLIPSACSTGRPMGSRRSRSVR
jgi:S-formylglutathione hydrolase FrmB